MSNNADKLRQRLEIRKYLVFAGMFLLFLGAMWFIFAPSEEDRRKEEKNAGFNTELPDPRGAGIEGDKIAAYEQADMKRKQAEKMRTLGDFSGISDENLVYSCHRMRMTRKAACMKPAEGRKPVFHPFQPTMTSTGPSAIFTSHRRKTRKRRP